MNTCVETLWSYGLRSLGSGPRVLPKGDISLCEQIVLIGSGMIWNLYFCLLALVIGFVLALCLAVARANKRFWLHRPADIFIFVFRGSPLFIQFFVAYELFVLLPKVGFSFDLGFVAIGLETRWLTRAWLGALIVLVFNTAAYSGAIFHGALQAMPQGDLEAAKAYGFSAGKRFQLIVWPTMLRLAWPAYTNEAIFMLHATALVFFSSFPTWRQQGDALYYANFFAEKTFNPFVAYPIAAVYFVLTTLLIVWVFGKVYKRLYRPYMGQEEVPKFKLKVGMR